MNSSIASGFNTHIREEKFHQWLDDPSQVDATWAACKRSRNSTRGGAMVAGSHGANVWGDTQAVIATPGAATVPVFA